MKSAFAQLRSDTAQELAIARVKGKPFASRALRVLWTFLKSKLFRRMAIGGLAGAAIGYGAPFISEWSGAALGAGGLVLYKSFTDKD